MRLVQHRHPFPLLVLPLVYLIVLLTLLAIVAATHTPGNYDKATRRQQQQQQQNDYYTAAVIEYNPLGGTAQAVNKTTAQKIMLNNVQALAALIAQAQAKVQQANNNIQIFVLPEYGLYGSNILSSTRDTVLNYLEHITIGSNPCLQFTPTEATVEMPVQYTLSCLAIKFNTTLVVDMGDVVYCTNASTSHETTFTTSSSTSTRESSTTTTATATATTTPCPSDGRFQYNTLVAIDNTGTILTKYHKRNLYFEDRVFNRGTKESSPRPYFESSFGVKFGMFICFDILFPDPQYDLLTKEHIQNFVYSSWWVNYPPIINAVQTQQGWSGYFATNLLASNIGQSFRSSGSGIYTSGKVLASVFNPTGKASDQVLVAKVPIVPIIDKKRQQVKEEEEEDRFSSQVGSNKAIEASKSSSDVKQNHKPLHAQYTLLRTAGIKIQRPLLQVAPFEVNELAQSGMTVRLTAIAGDLNCTAIISRRGQPTESSNSKNNGTLYFAVFATKGTLFALFSGEMCGIIRCGESITDCTRVANFTLRLQQSNTSFTSINLIATHSAAPTPSSMHNTDNGSVNKKNNEQQKQTSATDERNLRYTMVATNEMQLAQWGTDFITKSIAEEDAHVFESTHNMVQKPIVSAVLFTRDWHFTTNR